MSSKATVNPVGAVDFRPGGFSRWLKAFLIWAALLLVVAICAIVAVFLLKPKQAPTYRLKLATDDTPLCIFLAEKLKSEGARHHLDIVLSSKQYGSLDALDEVDSPSDFKLALVPGGITAREYPTLRTVTTLTKEPLHFLVRPEMASEGIQGLKGKRVNIGPASTSSHHLTREVLAFVGLTPRSLSGLGDYQMETVSPDELYRELGRIESLTGSAKAEAIKKLPDAAVFLAPLPSQLARRFVIDLGYQLLPVPFAEAFCLDRLNPPNPEGVQVDRSLLNPGVIPSFTYRTDPGVPATECPSICAPLLLVAQDDTDPEAVAKLLETIYDSPLTSAIRPPPLREIIHPFPLHVGTERYLRRNEPFLTPEIVSRLGTLAGGIGALASGLIALYTLLRLRKLNRFESYYRELGRIELVSRGLEIDPAAPSEPTALRKHLEERLSNLKCQVLEDFAEGGLKGEGLLAGIIALINDTRESLAQIPDKRE